MPEEEKVSINERSGYLRLIKEGHVGAGEFGRGHLLDEVQPVTGLHLLGPADAG